ncbi:MAG: hypothetical protein N2558_02380 [Patescibacteria group bacterium]|nr:hypothetical protein [Patescibacteria group bacterium]
MLNKKFFLSLFFPLILFAFLYILPSAKVVHAQLVGPWYDQTFPQWFIKVYEDSNPQEIFGERYTAAQVQWIFYSLVQLIPLPKRIIACNITFDVTGCATEYARMFTPISDATPLNEKSIAERVKSSAEVIAFSTTQDRPVSGIGYIRNSIEKFGLSNVYAQSAADSQGTGFRGLSPVRGLWQAARDVTYVLIVLVIIFLSFMIMFRMQISPQAVVTVQSSLWTVFKTLILITFSYAIAGFAVDLMYIIIGLISITFTQTGIFVSNNQNPALTIYQVLVNGPGGLGLIGFLLGYFQSFVAAYSFVLFTPEANLVSILSTSVSIGLFKPILVVLVIVLSISLLFIFFKVSWILIKSFANLLLLVILGPFQILIGSVYPGFGGFRKWISSIIQNLAVYPTVGVLFMMSYIFLSGAFFVDNSFSRDLLNFLNPVFNNSNPNALMIGFFGFGVNGSLFRNEGAISGWAPPMTFGSEQISLLWLFASYACVAMTPKVVEFIQSLISSQPFAYGSAIGQSIAGYGMASDAIGQYGTGFGRGLVSYGVESIKDRSKFRFAEAIKAAHSTGKKMLKSRLVVNN